MDSRQLIKCRVLTLIVYFILKSLTTSVNIVSENYFEINMGYILTKNTTMLI